MMPSLLERLQKEREARVKELYDAAEPTIQDYGGFGKHTARRYVVEIYEENTEFGACMYLLADIAKWFSVSALKDSHDV